MTRITAAQALADATAALVRDSDIVDVLSHLVRDCADVLSADAVGLLVIGADGRLELLSSTSHRAAELEIYQIQHDDGPCVEAIRSGAMISVAGTEEIVGRWPDVGAAIVAGGFQGVQAYPLRWRDRILGAMNVFRSDPLSAGDDAAALGPAFADMATVVILQSAELSTEDVTARIYRALEAGSAIERAKGVLAYTRQLDMAGAYDVLVALALERGASIDATAVDVIAEAQHRQ
jgi:hypothetical protein